MFSDDSSDIDFPILDDYSSQPNNIKIIDNTSVYDDSSDIDFPVLDDCSSEMSDHWNGYEPFSAVKEEQPNNTSLYYSDNLNRFTDDLYRKVAISLSLTTPSAPKCKKIQLKERIFTINDVVRSIKPLNNNEPGPIYTIDMFIDRLIIDYIEPLHCLESLTNFSLSRKYYCQVFNNNYFQFTKNFMSYKILPNDSFKKFFSKYFLMERVKGKNKGTYFTLHNDYSSKELLCKKIKFK